MQIPDSIKIIETKDKGNSIISSGDIKRGEVIFKFKGELIPKR
tara:strand:- start:5605 stop:5733 length:129 start_codon:yes stop_codon:yes gene_type:complete